MTTVHTLRIDGHDVAGAEGQTILTVARENGIDIPTMCHARGLSDTGACRLCVVALAGSPKLTPACTTLVAEGMEITTVNEELTAHRRTVIELMFLERNHVCAVCVANNDCELQDLAESESIDHFDLAPISPRLEVDATHPLFALDPNRCILCLRCVRVCAEVEGAHTWGVRGSGLAARVITDMGTLWGDSTTCTSCGKCVQVCPTAALFEKGRAIAEGGKARRRYLPFITPVETP
jgi:bidirectional [NiFe] hydrogenase diaphorase subunit